MIEGIRHWWRERKRRRLEKVAADAEGIREGREIWERERYGEREGGVGGSGRRTVYDEGHTRDDWSA